ncbi:YceI family protein [Henriciella sp.]|uniref:YceI family protein n=1 Tax=Henriciella sp. TaxID=1968823 RepID=UPI00260F868A|nr:YceI family protein [Henriciella sp.]
MKLTQILLVGASALFITACDPATGSDDTDVDTAVDEAETTPEGEATDVAEESDRAEKLQGVATATYELEPTHAFLSFTVTHGGVSEYTVDFTDFDATLDFNPDEPATSSIEVMIDPMGLNVNYPSDFKAGHPDSPYSTWPEALSKDERFLQAGEYPEITFVSTSAERTGDYTGTVTGDLTFLGVTKPVTMDVTYNGTANTPWTGERDLIGFNATTTFNRSEFGQESMAGVISDEVTVAFSGEFIQEEAE